MVPVSVTKAGFVVAASLAVAAAAAAQGEAVRLQPKAHRTWSVLLPNEQWNPVGAGFAVAHKNGERFAATAEGDVLRVDLDGDGQQEAMVEGETGFLTLTGTSKGGSPLSYAVRLQRPKGRPWQYSSGGALVGEIDGTRIQIFDQNLNGRFDDFGQDAMVVGKDNVASFLSRVVAIGGKLHEIEVAADGASFTHKPFAGPTGTLDLASQFECSAKLQAAIVVSADGKYSFNLAGAASGQLVPAGKYTVRCGQVVLGDSRAQLQTGRMAAIDVAADGKQSIAWGGPVQAEFAFHRKGDQITFAPAEIWYYGKQGEEWSAFMPLGKSPDFTIKNKATGETIVVAKFPGNC